MKCIVTAGPTYEPLDEVRRLTNFSTGRFGSMLANFLAGQGHDVTLLMGHYATYHGEQKAQRLDKFTTTADLRQQFQSFAGKGIDAIFHAAAVSDFGFGKVFEKLPDGTLAELKAGKIPTRSGQLVAELVPTEKILRQLRGWFPETRIVGWKYEVDGSRADVVAKAIHQLEESRTDACVANGPAYGFGFGVVTKQEHKHFSDSNELFGELLKITDPGA